MAGLDQDGRLVCWLRLPCPGNDLPTQLAALDALIASAEDMLNALPPIQSELSPEIRSQIES